MADTEPELIEGNGGEGFAQGADELLYALAEAIRAKGGKEAVAHMIRRYADDIERKGRDRKWHLFGSCLLGFVLACLIAWLGYAKVISNESTGTLIAALIGYIYRGRNV